MRLVAVFVASLLIAATCVVGVPVAVVPAAAAAAGTSVYRATEPTRVLDTREGLGASRPSDGGSFQLDLDDDGVIPAGATAVVLNLTATNVSGPGFVTVWPAGLARPTASSINYQTAGQTIANLVTTPVAADGRISLFTQLGVDLVADVQGYFVPATTAAAGRLVPLPPARVLDTREPNAVHTGLVGPDTAVDIDLTRWGVATDATAAVLKVTVTQPIAPGYWTAYASGHPRPTASNLNVSTPGQTIPNQVIAPLDHARTTIYAQSGGHLVVDLVGWFTGVSAATTAAGLFVPVAPNRLIDSRDPANGPGVKLRATNKVEVPVAMRAGVPATDVAAVLVNATVTDTTGPGFFTVWPGRTYRPNTSSLNATAAGQTLANHVITPVTASGFDIYTQSGSHVLADITGWFTGAPQPSELPPAVPLAGPSGPPDTGGYIFYDAIFGWWDTKQRAWEPCIPIRYAVNLNGYDPRYRRTITEAIERVQAATGLTFVSTGDSTLIPDYGTYEDLIGKSEAEGYARAGSYDLVIALAAEAESGLIAGSVDGQTSVVAWDTSPLRREIRMASVIVDMDFVASHDEWGSQGIGHVLLHELGHAVGLEHVYDDRTQLMFPSSADDGPLTFAAGDLRGLWLSGPMDGAC